MTIAVWALPASLLLGAAGGCYWWVRGRRARAKHRLAMIARGWLQHAGPAIAVERELGTGNAGSVALVRLGSEWSTAIGALWIVPGEVPRRAAFKLASFEEPQQRARLLAELGKEIVDAQRAGEIPALVPFLAVGTVDVPGAGRMLTELMPHIDGEPLDQHLKRAEPRVEDVLRRFNEVMDTVLWMEAHGWYTRNLDAENVLVQGDGAWRRIDFDNVLRRRAMPARRMRRLTRLALVVLEAIAPQLEPASVQRVRARLEATDDVHDDHPARITTPASLMALMGGLAQGTEGDDTGR